MPNRKGHQKHHSTKPLQPSSSGIMHEQLIKDLTQSKLFHELLADMIMHVLSSMQSKIDELTASFVAMEESFACQQKSIKELQNIADELKPAPVESPKIATSNELFLLRIRGLGDVESSKICEKLCHAVNTKMFIKCLPSDFSINRGPDSDTCSQSEESIPQIITREENQNGLDERKKQVFTISISSQELFNSIYRARTLLKGTSIFISEVLSKTNQYLFYLARNIKKVNKIASTWTYKGQVYIRLLDNIIKTINCPSELADL